MHSTLCQLAMHGFLLAGIPLAPLVILLVDVTVYSHSGYAYMGQDYGCGKWEMDVFGLGG